MTIPSVILLLLSFLSLAPPQDRQVEGFASLVGLNGDAKQISQFSYRALDPTFIERSSNGGQSFTWKTAPVPADAKEGTITFAFGVFLTGPKKSALGEHELTMDGKRLIKFVLPVEGDASWTEGGVSLRFDFLSADVSDDLEGVMYLTVPVRMLTPGLPAQLTAHGLASGTNCFFCLSAIERVAADPAVRPANNPVRYVPQMPVTAHHAVEPFPLGGRRRQLSHLHRFFHTPIDWLEVKWRFFVLFLYDPEDTYLS
jgi:hypothetical protein